MATVFDGHFEGVHYIRKSHLLGNDTIILYAEDFKLLTNRILELEYKLYIATDEYSKLIKEY